MTSRWWPSPDQLPIEGHGLSAFAREDDAVYHTYSAYARGTEALWGMWQWLDRAPLGRNERTCHGSTDTTNMTGTPPYNPSGGQLASL